jgi:hypothetical protein
MQRYCFVRWLFTTAWTGAKTKERVNDIITTNLKFNIVEPEDRKYSALIGASICSMLA